MFETERLEDTFFALIFAVQSPEVFKNRCKKDKISPEGVGRKVPRKCIFRMAPSVW